jgi:putative ABC transport system ATP-binding protein
MLADEPTGNLDRETGEKVIDLLFSLADRHGTTLILITHDSAIGARCEREIRIADGQAVPGEMRTGGVRAGV